MMDPVQLVAAAAVLVTSLGVIWRKAIRPVVHGVSETAEAVKGLMGLLEPDEDGRTIPQRLTGLEDQVSSLGDRVADIDERSKQLEPNGGHSLYDRVGKLEVGQANAMRQQQTFTKKLTPMVETIAALSGPPRRTTNPKGKR